MGESAMGLPPGTRLESYEIVAPLGSGGMGEVYLARDLRLHRKAAIKILAASLTADRDRVARFRQEAHAASALNHPNVCTIYTLGEAEDGRVFIAMEYIDGVTLRRRLTTDPIAVGHAIGIAEQIASALNAAHGAGVIHRDVKPENVMIRDDGLVKVLDFGLAKLDPRIASLESQSTQTAPQSAVVTGTLAYMSPEQARGQALDARTDIFSLGAVLYEMVTGHRAFAGSTTAIVHDAILNLTPASPVRVNRELPARLEDIVYKALEKDRTLRYQSAAEFRADLIRLKRDMDLRRDGSPVARTPAGRFRRWSVGASVVLALLTAVGASIAIRLHGWTSFGSRRDMQEVQLTSNSSEDPVTAAAISPDGKYVAYADQGGIHLRLIDSGQTDTIATPGITDINRLAWFPDGSKVVVSGGAATVPPSLAIWSLSVVGGTLRKLRDDGMEASVSPTGSHIVFVDGRRQNVWVMGSFGEEPHVAVARNPAANFEEFHLPIFWSTETRVGYAHLRQVEDQSGAVKPSLSVEWHDQNGSTGLLFLDPGLRGGLVLPGGRFVYSVVADPLSDRDASMWEVEVDPRNGARAGQPRHMHDWPGSVAVGQFSSTPDGKRMTLVKRTRQHDVYVAAPGPDGRLVDARRLTLNDSNDVPTAWTPDSTAVYFSSDRNGNFDIFRQSLDGRILETIVEGPEDELGPTAVSPDGRWLYYVVQPKGWHLTWLRPVEVMRIPASGGAPEKFGGEAGIKQVSCARSPSTTCVLIERASNQHEVAVYVVDPSNGKGRVITTIPVSGASSFYPAAISPDGTRVAVLMAREEKIHIVSLSGESPHDVRVTSRPLDMEAISWAADGAGVYVSSTSYTGVPSGTDLLHVDVNGRVSVVWHGSPPEPTVGIASPDGRHIAITYTSAVSNVWLLKF